DYLLKPFSLERFIVAVDKAIEKLNKYIPPAQQVPGETRVEDALFVKTDSKIFRIPHKDILYAEASGNYIKIVTPQTTYMPG
ncbi:MAG: DNA-binding response regulator, partial [Niastella sp.]|nr:DNA-binding response regulator [Niastella sp.]